MSQVEMKIKTLLLANAPVAAIIGTCLYPVILPQSPTLPAVTYFRVSGGQENSLKGYSGLEHPRIQIDCWSLTYAGAKELANAVRAAMDLATTFKALCISDHDLFEDDTRIYRVSLDFSVWNKE
jgi:hypothetical protein